MPSSFGGPRPALTWDPTNRPMYNPGDASKGSTSMWQNIIQSLLNLIPGAPEVIAFLKEFSNIDLTNPDTLFAPIVQALTDAPDSITATVNYLRTFFQNAVLGLLNAIAAALGKGPLDTLENIESWFSVESSKLTGQISSGLLGLVPIGHIGSAVAAPNLVQNPDFENLDSIESSVYSIDNTKSYTAKGGSAKVVADGTGSKDLLSNLIEVAQGQVISCSGFVTWANLVGTGTPIVLGITAYLNGSAVSQVDLVSQGVSPSSSDWKQLSNPWTVPVNVDSIRLRLTLSPSATSGSVNWDHLSVTKQSTTIPQRLIENLESSLSSLGSDLEGALSSLANKVEHADYQGLLNTLGGDLTSIGNRLGSFLTGASPLNANNINAGAIADQFVPGLGTQIDNIVNNIMNITGQGHSTSDQAAALQAQAAAITGMAAEIAKLKTTFTSGVSDGDDFERTSTTSLGTRWLTYYSNTSSGIWATPDGHDASFITNGVGTVDFISILNQGNIRSSTDLQVVGYALGSRPYQYAFPGLYNFCGHNDIWLRVSDDTTSLANVTGIRVRFSGDGSVSIVRFVAGVATTLASLSSGSISVPGPGALLYGVAGQPGTARVFQAIINTTPVLTIPEVGVASGLGAAFRRWGHGGRTEGHTLPLPGQEIPGRLWQITMADQ